MKSFILSFVLCAALAGCAQAPQQHGREIPAAYQRTVVIAYPNGPRIEAHDTGGRLQVFGERTLKVRHQDEKTTDTAELSVSKSVMGNVFSAIGGYALAAWQTVR